MKTHVRLALLGITLVTLAGCSGVNTSLPTTEIEPLFGTARFDRASGVAAYSAGVYVAGVTDGVLGGTSAGYRDAFIRKFAASGTMVWSKQFGSPKSERGTKVATDTLDNAYVVGSTGGAVAGTNKGSDDVFIRKYTPSGSIAWTRQFGSAAFDAPRSVAVFRNTIYVVGLTTGNLGGTNLGNYDSFIRAYDANGTPIWTRLFGTLANDEVENVAVDELGDIYVVGATEGALAANLAHGYDAFVRKYSPNGDVYWNRQIDNSNAYGQDDRGTSVAIAGGSVYVGTDLIGMVAIRYPKVFRFGLDGSGPSSFGPDLWSGYNSFIDDLSADSDGSVYLAGRTERDICRNKIWYGKIDGFVMKVNANGSRVWCHQIGTPEDDDTAGVVARNTLEVYAVGETEGLLSGSYLGNGDAYVRRLAGNNGSAVWTK